MLDLKPTTDDEQRLKTNILPGESETSALEQYVKKKSYQHLPNLNAMYNMEMRMQEIMEAPQLFSWEKSKLNSDQLNRLLTFKNQMNQKSMETLVQRAPSVLSNVSELSSPVSPEPAEINAPPVHETPKPQTPKLSYPTERPKLKRNFFHNWIDSSDWRPKDLAMMTPEQRESYECRLLRERPKYIPMKPEEPAKLSPEERQEYENSLNITKTPALYIGALCAYNTVIYIERSVNKVASARGCLGRF